MATKARCSHREKPTAFTRLLKTASLVCFLASCITAGTPISWDKARKIHTGMPEPELVTLMGKPSSVTSRADGTLIYAWAFVGADFGTKSVSAILKDGVVTSAPVIPASFKD